MSYSSSSNLSTSPDKSSMSPQRSLADSKIISVEGNIGSGKSTLLRLIKDKVAETQVVREPVNNWQAIGDNPKLNLLDAFYTNPHRWGYTF